jgi:hypothetical protein
MMIGESMENYKYSEKSATYPPLKPGCSGNGLGSPRKESGVWKVSKEIKKINSLRAKFKQLVYETGGHFFEFHSLYFNK